MRRFSNHNPDGALWHSSAKHSLILLGLSSFIFFMAQRRDQASYFYGAIRSSITNMRMVSFRFFVLIICPCRQQTWYCIQYEPIGPCGTYLPKERSHGSFNPNDLSSVLCILTETGSNQSTEMDASFYEKYWRRCTAKTNETKPKERIRAKHVAQFKSLMMMMMMTAMLIVFMAN